jgi:glycerophosphoryl diester phosphodiesterase
MGMQDQIVVMSLKYDAVQKVRSLRPDWTLGLLTAVAIGDLTRLDADFLAVNTGLASRTFVRNAHAAGKEVLVWTVNDPLTAYAMISRGVDGIITDDPAMGRRVLAFYDELNGVERLLAEVAILIGAVELDDEEPEEIG